MSIEIRKGTSADLDAYAELLYNVHKNMSNKEWFYLDSREELQQQMDEGIMELWLAVDGEMVVGAFDLLVPGLRPINYGYALGFTKEELLQAVNMDSAAVHPDYRGRGIQRKLLQMAEVWLKEQGKRILLCTVHPENTYSLGNVRNLGYTVQKKIPIYGSVRYVLRKDI